MSEEHVDHALAVKRRVEEDLLGLPGVHAVSLGHKNGSGELAIIVHVVRKQPLDALPAAERIPREIDGVKTDVVVTPLPEAL